MHFIDWTSNDTFMLRHLAAGSDKVAQLEGIKSSADSVYGDTLLAAVSERLLRLAVNTRVIILTLKEMDYYDSHDFVFNGEHSTPVCQQETEEKVVNILQLCHKIVHATFISLEWIAIKDGKQVEVELYSEENSCDYRYWSGNLWICGTREDQEWTYLINVKLACDAFDWFLDDDSIGESWSRAYRKNVF